MSIVIQGMPELLTRIDTIQKFRRVKAAVKAAGTFLRGKIKKAPHVNRRKNMMLYGNGERARRMRAGFFYHLKHGDIEVPYYRGRSRASEKLSQSWAMETENYGFRAIVGTNVSYAPLVQDRDEQTAYHAQGGWITVQGVRNLYGRQAIEFIEAALVEEVGGKTK